MNDKSIRLHREYGLNPTMPVCFWCGKDTGEIALLGAAYRDKAPRHMVLCYEPCEACSKQMAQGITLMEAKGSSEPKPTGRWVVVTEEAVRKFFSPEGVVESILKQRRAFIQVEAFEQLFGGTITESPSEDPS